MDAVEDIAAAGHESLALRCWVEGRRVWLELADQRLVSFPALKYPRLADAPQELLEKVHLRIQGRALRWEELDEDIWIADAVSGRFIFTFRSATWSSCSRRKRRALVRLSVTIASTTTSAV